MNEANSEPRVNDEIVKSPAEARQGAKRHNVRYVLTVGTVGAIVALGVVYFLFFAG